MKETLKNISPLDVFDSRTITLIIYYGYVIVISVILLYWKLIEKKPLSEIGLTKHIGSYFIGVIGMINLTLISLIFSSVTIRFQSIWAACGLHSFWNFMLSGIMGLNVSGNGENTTAILHMQSVGSNIWNGGIYGIEASVLTTFVLGIISILLWIYGKRVKTKI